MQDLTKRAARLDRKLKRLAPDIAAAVKLAGELARDLKAQFADLEARVEQLRPMASALAGKAPAARTSGPVAVDPLGVKKWTVRCSRSADDQPGSEATQPDAIRPARFINPS